MSALVLYSDKVLYICAINNIFVTGKRCKAKYSDGFKYEARVLAICNDESILEDLQMCIEGNSRHMAINLIVMDSEAVNHATAMKKRMQSAGDILFVERAIVPEIHAQTQIYSVLIKEEILKIPRFFAQPSYFIELKKNNINQSGKIDKEPLKVLKDAQEFLDLPEVKDKELGKIETQSEGMQTTYMDNSHSHVVPNSHGDMEISLNSPSRKSEQSFDIKSKSKDLNGTYVIKDQSVEDSSHENSEVSENVQNSSYGFIIDETILSTSEDKGEEGPFSGLLANKPSVVPDLNGNVMSSAPLKNMNTDTDMVGQRSADQPLDDTSSRSKSPLSSLEVTCPVTPVDNNKTFEIKNSQECNTIVNQTIYLDNVQLTEQDLLANYHEGFDLNDTNILLIDGILNNFSGGKFNENDRMENFDVLVNDLSMKEITHPETDTPKQQPRIVKEERVNYPLYQKFSTSNLLGGNYQTSKDENSNVLINNEPAPFFEATSTPSASFGENNIQEPEVSEPSNDEDEEYDPLNEEIASSAGEDELVDDENNEENVEEKAETGGVTKVHDGSLRTDPHASAPDDRDLTVDSSDAGPRKHFCLYCCKFQSKIARHLENVHSNEENVKKFTALPPKNKERQEIIAMIRKAGDDRYNSDRNINTGKLIPRYRPNARMHKNATGFEICPHCDAQYSRTSLHHHFRKFTEKNGNNERIIRIQSKKIAARIHHRANSDVRRFVFSHLREDEVVRGIRYDELLILYANKQCDKYGTYKHQYEMIRGKIRRIGKFLLAIKARDQRILNLSNVFHPKFYDVTLEAVREISKFNETEKKFGVFTNATNMKEHLKSLGAILRSEYIKQEKKEQQQHVEDFLKLLEEDWGVSINRVAAETQAQLQRRKQIILPSTEDVQKVYSFVVQRRQEKLSELEEDFSFETWKALAQYTLVSLLIFNRRRPGEIERLYLEDFESRRGIDQVTDKEIYEKLSKEGKKLADTYYRIMIRGKKGRAVPVLVDRESCLCLQLLIRHRENARIPATNSHLFALPSDNKDEPKYLRAYTLMNRYALEAGAANPSIFNATNLRKHIATKCVDLQLDECQVSNLANFMGHADKIHKEIYRQPVLQTDIVGIAKLLHMAQGGDDDDDFGDDDNETEIGASVNASHSRASSSRDYTMNIPRLDPNQFSRFSASNAATPRKWGIDERNAVLTAFKKQLEESQMPTGKEMEALIRSTTCLSGRTVPQLRTWLHTWKKKLSNK